MVIHQLLHGLRQIQKQLRDHVRRQLRECAPGSLSSVTRHSAADVLYGIDVECDEILFLGFEELARIAPFLVVAEGISEDAPVPFPGSTSPTEAEYTLILDPIDGTRMIMFDKRSAWSLAAIARNHGKPPTFQDIEAAVMTEIPPSKQTSGDCLWAFRREGTQGEREDFTSGVVRSWRPTPNPAADLSHGFAQFTKFFLGDKETLARIEEEVFGLLGANPKDESPRLFDDQYLSTGGQLYEILAGRDLFQADVRRSLRRQSGGSGPSLACHPYDICVELIARECGVVITDIHGSPIRCPLDVSTDVDWMGFANENLRNRMMPILQSVFGKAGWGDGDDA